MEKINILNDFLFYLVLLDIFIKGLIRWSKKFLCFFFGSIACLWFLNIKEEKGFRQYNTTQIYLENQTAVQASIKSVRKNLLLYVLLCLLCFIYVNSYFISLIGWKWKYHQWFNLIGRQQSPKIFKLYVTFRFSGLCNTTTHQLNTLFREKDVNFYQNYLVYWIQNLLKTERECINTKEKEEERERQKRQKFEILTYLSISYFL